MDERLTVGYLVLVDRGTLSLDTDMRQYSDELKAATSKVVTGFDKDGPVTVDIDIPVTLGQMLNQSSGFGMEFGDKVQKWKVTADKGKGFVNSCKKASLSALGRPKYHDPISND